MKKICESSFFGDKTTLYKIEKGFRSSGSNIVLFFDELYQPNAIDKDGIPQNKCDENRWSMDNLRIRVIKYQ